MAGNSEVDILNRLLRDERAAAAAYGRVLSQSAIDQKVWDIDRIRRDHEQFAGRLELEIMTAGGREDSGVGVDVFWPETRKEPFLKLDRDKTTLRALRECENQELQACRVAVGSGSLRTSWALVKSGLLENLQEHVNVLDRIIES